MRKVCNLPRVVSITRTPVEPSNAVVAVIDSILDNILIVLKSGTNQFVVYDSLNGFSSLFVGSSVQIVDENRRFTLRPVGGWWMRFFSLKFFTITDVESVTTIVQTGTGRWNPIIATIANLSGVGVIYTSGNSHNVVYDPVDEFADQFTNQSKVEVVGQTQVMTILPNGGWSASGFSLKFYSAIELSVDNNTPAFKSMFIAASTATIGVGNLTAFDVPVLTRVLSNATLLVLNVETTDLDNLLIRIRSIYPNLPIYFYFPSQRISPNSRVYASMKTEADARAQELGVIKKSGVAKLLGTQRWIDLNVKATRDWMVDKIEEIFNTYNFDGCFGDNCHLRRLPFTPYAGTIQLAEHCSTIKSRLYTSDGTAGTFEIANTGVGAGTFTVVSAGVYKFEAQVGVTTVAQMESAITSFGGVLGVADSDPTAHVITAGDIIGPTNIPSNEEAGTTQIEASVKLLYAALQTRFPDKVIGYNGIWNQAYLDMILTQRKLLTETFAPNESYADFATEEFFGLKAPVTTDNPDPNYVKYVEKIGATVVQLTKPTQIHATGPDVYITYQKNLAGMRYGVVGWFQDCWSELSTLIVSQHYNWGRLARARMGCWDRNSYQDLRLGTPLGIKTSGNNTGGYYREFVGGFTYIAPEDLGPQFFTTTAGLWTTKGRYIPAGTRFVVQDSDGLILLRSRPTLPPAEFSATIADDPAEWLMQMTCGEHRYRRLRVRYTTSDAAAKILIRGEVNDDLLSRPYAVAHVLTSGGSVSGTKDIPYKQISSQNASQFACTEQLLADGVEHTLEINLETAFGSAGVCMRVPSIRASGAITVSSLVLSDYVEIEEDLDPTKPVAAFSSIVTLLSVQMINESVDNDGTIVGYFWTSDEGHSSTAVNPTFVFATTGYHTVTLTVTDNDGQTNSFTGTVRPVVTTDGPNDVLWPKTTADWNAVGVAAPQHSWAGNIASGNLIDSVGSLNLTNTLVTDFQQPTGITGWSSVGVKFTEVSQQRFESSVNCSFSTQQHLLLLLVKFGSIPTADRAVCAFDAGFFVREKKDTGKFNSNNNGSIKGGSTAYVNDVYLVGVSWNPTGPVGQVETNINTPDPIVTSVPTAIADGHLIIGAKTGTTATSLNDMVLLHAWMWDSGTIPTFAEISLALGWTEAPEEA